MDIKEIVENAMSEAESKYPPSDIENALENVLKRAENTAPGEERAAVRANTAAATNVRTGEHKIIKALAGIAAVAAVLAGTFLGLKYLSDNNIELLKEGGGSVTVTGTNEPAVTAAQVTTAATAETAEVTTSAGTVWLTAGPGISVMTPESIDYDSMTEEERFVALLMNGLQWGMNEREIQIVAQVYWGRNDMYEQYDIPADDEPTDYSILSYNDIDFYSRDAELLLTVDDSTGLREVQFQVICGEDGYEKAEELFDHVRADLTETFGESSEDIPNEWHSADDRIILCKVNEMSAVWLKISGEAERSRDAETESTTETSAEITTNALLHETEAETTEPAEVSPTDDELKALVKQGAEACGLKITVSDLTKASLKLNYYCEGDNSKYLAFMWGGKYEIQILSGNEWMTYDPDNFRRWNDEQMWFDSSFSINEFPDHSDEHETILFYGDNMYESEIPKGNYRVLKQIAVYGNGKNLGQLTAYAEFTIDEHTTNVFGITMTAKNVSPESVTLAVQQSGASFHVKRNLGYEARFVLESKTGSGEWKKVDGNPVTWAPDIEPINENGVTEIKEDFSDIYGSLPDGTYRISKQFVNYVGTGETKDDILNSSTYYCEFVIGEKTHDWGITMSAKDVTPAGMTLLIDQKGGNSTGELTYGEDFSIEIKSDEFGTWEKLGYITDEINWTDIGYILEPGAHNENQINWTYIYGYLPAGHYRLVKEFMDFRKTGDYDQCDFYMEFDVPEIDSKLGITLNTKRNTARWITLDAASIGDTVSEHMSFNENRYVIEQKKNGKWTEYYTTAVPGIPTPETARKINAGDVVTFTVDWRERAGSLPVGEYRIGITFTGGSVSETINAEFTVEEYMTNEFGLQIRPIEISQTGGKFVIESLGGDYSVLATYGDEFTIQKQTGSGKWKDLPVPDGFGWTEMFTKKIWLTADGGNAGISEEFEWSKIYGILSAGHYRLGKKFSAVIDGKTKEIMICCEFDITADTPEKIAE